MTSMKLINSKFYVKRINLKDSCQVKNLFKVIVNPNFSQKFNLLNKRKRELK